VVEYHVGVKEMKHKAEVRRVRDGEGGGGEGAPG
jgi:hypothetical protein